MLNSEKTFGVADDKIATWGELLGESGDKSGTGWGIKIDHDVSTENHMLSPRDGKLSLEEVDTMIEVVHKGEVVNHKKVTTMIRNKASYNTFFDDMIIYSKIIVILTSNKSKEEIDKLDTSYLRHGRVNAYYKMMNPLVV